MTNTYFYVISRYVDYCYLHPSAEQLESLLSRTVHFKQEDASAASDSLVDLQGKIEVVRLFRKTIFSHPSDLKLKNYSIKERGEGIELKVTFEEKKEEERGKMTTYLFKEKTSFLFTDTDPDLCQIKEIDTKIRKQPVASPQPSDSFPEFRHSYQG